MKSNFSRLKRKLLLQSLLTVSIAGLVGLFFQNVFIDGLLEKPFANWFISFVEKVFYMDDASAKSIYSVLFRYNKASLLAIGFIVLAVVVFYFVLSRFMHYFNQISNSIDRLAEESQEPIQLPPELDFMQNKLNTIKSTLEKRAADSKEAEQRKNDLVVYLAHDIKTPLTSVIGYLSLLSEASDMPESQRNKYVDITLEKAYRLEQLINEFFEITRFNLQTIVLNKEEINISYMLMQIADEFYPMLEPGKRTIAVKAEDNLTVYADPDKLARVFNNILKNAVAYSYPESEITVAAYQNEESIIIEFINLGKPIAQEKLQTIFEKFYRLDAARSGFTGGAGLGLAIAKEIVAAHGGSISAASSVENTIFTVKLPSHSLTADV